MTDTAPPTLRLFPNAVEMAQGLAEAIAARLDTAIQARGVASFVTSGGSTPGDMYDVLSRADIAWDRVVVTVSDERWVSRGAEGSNEKRLRDRLLQNKAAAASYVGLRTDHDTPALGAQAAEERIAALPRPFDVTLVGMGPDSHTASLYPLASGLAEALDTSRPNMTAAVNPVEAVGSNQRLSLSLRALLDSRIIIILFRGEEKLAVYRAALAGANVHEAPVRALIHQSQTPVEVWWAP